MDYQSEDGLTRADARFDGESIWLSQSQLVELYRSSKANISEHIKHVQEEGEVDAGATVRNFRTVQPEGKRQVAREIAGYNLVRKESFLTAILCARKESSLSLFLCNR